MLLANTATEIEKLSTEEFMESLTESILKAEFLNRFGDLKKIQTLHVNEDQAIIKIVFMDGSTFNLKVK